MSSLKQVRNLSAHSPEEEAKDVRTTGFVPLRVGYDGKVVPTLLEKHYAISNKKGSRTIPAAFFMKCDRDAITGL